MQQSADTKHRRKAQNTNPRPSVLLYRDRLHQVLLHLLQAAARGNMPPCHWQLLRGGIVHHGLLALALCRAGGELAVGAGWRLVLAHHALIHHIERSCRGSYSVGSPEKSCGSGGDAQVAKSRSQFCHGTVQSSANMEAN